MEIFIQARKDGYNVLFPKITPKEFYKFASDLQSASAKNDSKYYGKNFYSLAYTDGGYIFTKYVIGYDTQRNNLGNVGISVFIPIAKKLSGDAVKKLLDELLSVYCQNYCDENKITNKREDWNLFTSVLEGYKKFLGDNLNDDLITVGSKEPAFHFYRNDLELLELFDNPFQEEYTEFKQVFFINNQLKDTANPLDVIKNSGVEVNPDLKNKSYYLNNYSISKGVTITANGKPRSDKKGENQIRAKWQVEINYSKDDRCYEPISESGTLDNTNSDIFKYLEISGNQIRIKYEEFNPNPIKLQVEFKIKNRKGQIINDAVIICKNKNYLPDKMATNNTTDFMGEDLKSLWTAIVRKGDFSGKKEFVPKKNESVEVVLEERKIITIHVNEGQRNIEDFEVWTKLTNGFKRTNSIEFVDEQIIDTYTITVHKEGYIDEEIRNFYPYKENSIEITLRKRQESFKTPKEQGSDDQTEKRKSFASKALKFFIKPGVIAIIVIAIVAGIILLRYFKVKDKQTIKPLTENQISDYILGDSLMLHKLNAYEEKWKTQKGDGEVLKSLKQAIEKRTKIDSKKFDELEYDDFKFSEPQQDFIKAIDSILDSGITNNEISNHLGDISSLTLTQIVDSVYAALALKSQEIPKNLSQGKADKQIKEEKNKTQTDEPEDITNYLETNSGFELSTINQYYSVKGLSNELNNSLKLVKNFINGGYRNCNSFRINASNDKFLKTNPNLESWVENVCKDSSTNASNSVAKSNNLMQTPATIDKTAEIIQYLKGSELEEAKLIEYKNTEGINQNLKNSIQLCLDFWALDGSGSGKKSKTYWTFRTKINADNNLSNSKLKEFVDKMCQEGVKPSYSEIDKKRGLK